MISVVRNKCAEWIKTRDTINEITLPSGSSRPDCRNTRHRSQPQQILHGYRRSKCQRFSSVLPARLSALRCWRVPPKLVVWNILDQRLHAMYWLVLSLFVQQVKLLNPDLTRPFLFLQKYLVKNNQNPDLLGLFHFPKQ